MSGELRAGELRVWLSALRSWLSALSSMSREHIQFVTGRLAEHSLREIVVPLAQQVGFDYTIDVLPITVAALMTPEWIARRISTCHECHSHSRTRLLHRRLEAD